MVKIMSQRFFYMQPFLSTNLCDFLQLVKFFFGYRVYDVKHLIKFFPNFHGDLDKVSESLGLDNSCIRSHHAGSNSLVTLHVFNKTNSLLSYKVWLAKICRCSLWLKDTLIFLFYHLSTSLIFSSLFRTM